MTAQDHTIRTLGYVGLVPFAGFALLLWQPALVESHFVAGSASISDQLSSYAAFLGYSAVILSFLGGVFWGQALQLRRHAKATALLLLSNLFALVAWAALSLSSPVPALLLLMAGYLSLLAVEWRVSAQHPRLPQWSLSEYLPMRIVLTIAVVLVHLLVLAHFLSMQG